MPDINDRPGAVSVEVLLAEFDRRKGHFDDLRRKTKSLMEEILAVKQVKYHSVQSRVKDRINLESKYCSRDKDYICLSDIPDIVGIRIITYYADAVDQVKNIILREFSLIGQIDDKRLAKANEFGYSAVHLDCTYSTARCSATEYARFANIRFEIQITTILGHAWAEIHHEWYDRRSSSRPEEERSLNRLAALLELADQEFGQIRKKKVEREKLTSVRRNLLNPADPQEIEDELWNDLSMPSEE